MLAREPARRLRTAFNNQIAQWVDAAGQHLTLFNCFRGDMHPAHLSTLKITVEDSDLAEATTAAPAAYRHALQPLLLHGRLYNGTPDR